MRVSKTPAVLRGKGLDLGKRKARGELAAKGMALEG